MDQATQEAPTAKPIGPPELTTSLLEAIWPLEFAGLLAMRRMLRRVGRGDEHPVLVLPGFTANDVATAQLRGILRANGYRTHGWGLGTNIGPTDKIVSGIRTRLEELAERHDQPITLIGWSLGGIFARMLARERPDLVRQVITLVSPFRLTEADRTAADPLFELFAHRHLDDFDLRTTAEQDREPLEVPATSIYTRTDGVVAWQLCIDASGPMSENVEVYASHSGVVINPAALYAILDRLRQPEDAWSHFQPPFTLRLWYPHAASWSAARAA